MTRPIRWAAYGFLLPALLLLGITSFWPTLQAFYLSFTNYDILTPPEWINVQNYLRLWQDPLFWKALRNTLIYLVIAVPALVALPLLLAILVNQKLRGISWFRVVYYLPVIFSVVVAGIAWKWIYAENGLLNYLLSRLTFSTPEQPLRITWLTDPHLAIYAICAVTIWKGLGYYMVIYLAGLQGIPQNLYEAAAIDGASTWKKHWYITLPLMQPYLLLVMVLSAIGAMKVFEEVYVMSRGGPAKSTLTIVYYLYEKGITDLEMGYASAIGMVLFMLVFSLSLASVQLLDLRGSRW